MPSNTNVFSRFGFSISKISLVSASSVKSSPESSIVVEDEFTTTLKNRLATLQQAECVCRVCSHKRRSSTDSLNLQQTLTSTSSTSSSLLATEDDFSAPPVYKRTSASISEIFNTRVQEPTIDALDSLVDALTTGFEMGRAAVLEKVAFGRRGE